MAMSASGLKAKIKTEFDSAFGPAEDDSKLDKFAEAVAKAVVEYIQANATTTCGAGPGTVS